MIDIVREAIDRESVISSVTSPEAGAIVTFDGTVRNHARGRKVTHLYYEAYPEMARREMEKIQDEVMRRWPVQGFAMVHRVGRLEIGESSIFIAVSAAHREIAFEACRFAIDTLKTTVPIWKKEHYQDGQVWVEEYGSENKRAKEQKSKRKTGPPAAVPPHDLRRHHRK